MAPMLMTLAVMHTMALRAVEALRVVTLSELLSMAPRSAEASPLSPRAALLTVAPQVTMRDDVITALSSTLGDGRRVELEYPLMDFKELPVCVARTLFVALMNFGGLLMDSGALLMDLEHLLMGVEDL